MNNQNKENGNIVNLEDVKMKKVEEPETMERLKMDFDKMDDLDFAAEMLKADMGYRKQDKYGVLHLERWGDVVLDKPTPNMYNNSFTFTIDGDEAVQQLREMAAEARADEGLPYRKSTGDRCFLEVSAGESTVFMGIQVCKSSRVNSEDVGVYRIEAAPTRSELRALVKYAMDNFQQWMLDSVDSDFYDDDEFSECKDTE